MALCPFAVKKLIKPGANDPAIKPIGAILHVDAGNAASLYEFFRDRSGGIESHFHIRKDGVIEQYRDTEFEADANYKANSFFEGGVRKGYVSIETQGLEAGQWTPEQVASIKRLLRWLNTRHGIPLRVCQSPTDPGVGYHTLFGAPSAWTPVAKSCPGPDRKVQFRRVLVPWMQRVTDQPVAPAPPSVPVPAPEPVSEPIDWQARAETLAKRNRALRKRLKDIAEIAGGGKVA